MRLAALALMIAVTTATTPVAAATAYFSGGNFHELQAPFDAVSGVTGTRLGYAGSGTETIEISYDETLTTYQALLATFWRNIDPFDAGGQFCDHGATFAAAVYPATPAEREQAEASLNGHEHRFRTKIGVTIAQGPPNFRPAAEWHQLYYLKSPSKYRFRRLSCGRDARLREIWGGDAPQ